MRLKVLKPEKPVGSAEHIQGIGRAYVPILMGLIIIGAFFAPQFINGFTFAPGDNMLQNLPLRALVGADLRSGILPLWNPYLWSGIPLLGSMNAGAGYPLSWLFAILPVLLAWKINVIAAYLVAWLGVWAYTRQIGMRITGAMISATSFALGGFMIDQMAHIGDVISAAWIPLALYGIERCTDEATPWRGVGVLSLAVTLMVYGGSPEPIVYGTALLSLYSVLIVLKTEGPQRRMLIVLLTSAFGLAVIASLGQLLPAYQFIQQSQRAHVSFAFFSSFALSSGNIPLLWLPYLWGADVHHLIHIQFFGPNGALAGYYSYVSLGALAAYFGSLVWCPGWRRKYWVVIATGGFLLALGSATPLDKLMYHVPIYDQLRVQGRNLLEVDLALSVLAGDWLTRFVKLPTLSQAVGLIGGFGFPLFLAVVGGLDSASLGGVARVFGVTPPPSWSQEILPYLMVAAMGACGWSAILLLMRRRGNRWYSILLMGIFCLDLFVNGQQDAWTMSPSYQGPSFVSVNPSTTSRELQYYPGAVAPFTTVTDENILHGIASAQGYGALIPADYQFVTQSHILGTFNPALLKPNSPMLKALNVNLVYMSASNDQTALWEVHSPWALKHRGTNVVYTRRVPDHLVWYVSTVKRMSLPKTLADLSTGTLDLSNAAYSPTFKSASGGLTGRANVSVSIHTPTKLSINVDATRAGYLVLSQEYFPGWYYKFAHKVRPVQRVDGIFQGVPVPKGVSEVVVTYQPTSDELAIGLSVLAGLFELFLLMRPIRRRSSL